MSKLVNLAEEGRLPEPVVRWGARRLISKRLADLRKGSEEARRERRWAFIRDINKDRVALEVEKANEQHYEVPSEFFTYCLGPRMKYSSAYYPKGSETLAEAEEAMLALVCDRAELYDGMKFLDLGCGWGSLSLYVAEKFPNAQVLGVSNSNSQREFILAKAASRGLKNIQIITRDMNELTLQEKFDRIASIEMFEHMRNFGQLLRRVRSWLKPDGKLFIHIFCHKDQPYIFETEGAANWMGRHFFTAGMMPFDEIFSYFQDTLRVEKNWVVDGTHYQKTSRDWLRNLESNKENVMPILEKAYGKKNATIWFNRWRLFFIACEETFGFNRGQEWWVSHSLLSPSKD